jgi:hypothetical protein
LEYEPDAGLSSARRNSIVERVADIVDVTIDSDRQRRLSAVTLPQWFGKRQERCEDLMLSHAVVTAEVEPLL